MMDNRKIPAPFYAAAGAGDIAYRKLRELSDKLAENMRNPEESPLRQHADDLRTRAEQVRGRAMAHDFRADMNRMVGVAAQKAQIAQVRATKYYHDLVLRGERVVRGAEYTVADTATTVANELETTASQPGPAEVAPGTSTGNTAISGTAGAKPAKRTRPRKQTTT